MYTMLQPGYAEEWLENDDPQLPPTEDQIQINLLLQQQAKAKAQLTKNDITATRCKKAQVPYPPEWLAYDNMLRQLASATEYDPVVEWPVTPDFPAGS